MCQTVAAASGGIVAAAGLVSGIPALQLLGYRYSFGALALFAASVSLYGGFVYIFLNASAYACAFVCMHLSMNVCSYICVYMFSFIDECRLIYMRLYVCIYR